LLRQAVFQMGLQLTSNVLDSLSVSVLILRGKSSTDDFDLATPCPHERNIFPFPQQTMPPEWLPGILCCRISPSVAQIVTGRFDQIENEILVRLVKIGEPCAKHGRLIIGLQPAFGQQIPDAHP